jgi:hypothetical protein
VTCPLPAISALEKSDTMGERIRRIRQIRTDFFYRKARISSKKLKKNPFQSAESAQSVLPLYLHFPKRKLLVHCFIIRKTLKINELQQISKQAGHDLPLRIF